MLVITTARGRKQSKTVGVVNNLNSKKDGESVSKDLESKSNKIIFKYYVSNIQISNKFLPFYICL